MQKYYPIFVSLAEVGYSLLVAFLLAHACIFGG